MAKTMRGAVAPVAVEEGLIKRMDPLSNTMFIHMFGRNESVVATRKLINAFFRRVGLDELDKIEQIHAEHTDVGDIVGCKEVRYDVFVFAEGRVVDLESERVGADHANRSLMYAAKMLATYTNAGAKYGDLPQAVVLTLMNAPKCNLPRSESLVTVADIRWDVDGGCSYSFVNCFF